MNKNHTIFLKADDTGNVYIKEGEKEKSFSSPKAQGAELTTLYEDLKQGDIIELTFVNIRKCPHCKQKLE